MKRPLILGMLAQAFASYTSAATITINPADYPDGSDISNVEAPIALSAVQGYVNFVDNDTTPTLLETIRQTGGKTSGIFAQNGFFATKSANNWASDPQFGRYEILKADFLTPANFVSLNFHADDIDTGVLGAFDSSDKLLSHQYLRSPGDFELKFKSSSKNIAYILAGTSDPAFIGKLSANITQVPVPAPVGLFVVGLLGLALFRRCSA